MRKEALEGHRPSETPKPLICPRTVVNVQCPRINTGATSMYEPSGKFGYVRCLDVPVPPPRTAYGLAKADNATPAASEVAPQGNDYLSSRWSQTAKFLRDLTCRKAALSEEIKRQRSALRIFDDAERQALLSAPDFPDALLHDRAGGLLQSHTSLPLLYDTPFATHVPFLPSSSLPTPAPYPMSTIARLHGSRHQHPHRSNTLLHSAAAASLDSLLATVLKRSTDVSTKLVKSCALPHDNDSSDADSQDDGEGTGSGQNALLIPTSKQHPVDDSSASSSPISRSPSPADSPRGRTASDTAANGASVMPTPGRPQSDGGTRGLSNTEPKTVGHRRNRRSSCGGKPLAPTPHMYRRRQLSKSMDGSQGGGSRTCPRVSSAATDRKTPSGDGRPPGAQGRPAAEASAGGVQLPRLTPPGGGRPSSSAVANTGPGLDNARSFQHNSSFDRKGFAVLACASGSSSTEGGVDRPRRVRGSKTWRSCQWQSQPSPRASAGGSGSLVYLTGKSSWAKSTTARELVFTQF